MAAHLRSRRRTGGYGGERFLLVSFRFCTIACHDIDVSHLLFFTVFLLAGVLRMPLGVPLAVCASSGHNFLEHLFPPPTDGGSSVCEVETNTGVIDLTP